MNNPKNSLPDTTTLEELKGELWVAFEHGDNDDSLNILRASHRHMATLESTVEEYKNTAIECFSTLGDGSKKLDHALLISRSFLDPLNEIIRVSGSMDKALDRFEHMLHAFLSFSQEIDLQIKSESEKLITRFIYFRRQSLAAHSEVFSKYVDIV